MVYKQRLGDTVFESRTVHGVEYTRIVKAREPKTRKPRVKDVLDKRTRDILGYGADPLSRARGELHAGKPMGGMIKSADKSMFIRSEGKLKLKTNRRV